MDFVLHCVLKNRVIFGYGRVMQSEFALTLQPIHLTYNVSLNIYL